MTRSYDYDDWLGTDQECADDLRFVNWDVLHFRELGLSVRQDRRLGKGGHVWDGAYVLAEHVRSVPPTGRVLEVGAGGTGLPGLTAAALGCDVVLTDGDPALVSLLQDNARSFPTASARVLAWPSDDDAYWQPRGEQVDLGMTFDCILAAECVAPIYDATALLDAVLRHADASTEVRFVCKDARNPDHYSGFYDLLRQRFHITSLGPPADSRLNHAKSDFSIAICRPLLPR